MKWTFTTEYYSPKKNRTRRKEGGERKRRKRKTRIVGENIVYKCKM